MTHQTIAFLFALYDFGHVTADRQKLPTASFAIKVSLVFDHHNQLIRA